MYKRQALLRCKADTKYTVDDGCSALFLAAQEGHVGIVEDLLAAGADPNTKRPDGTSVLQIATTRHHPRVAQALKSAGARPLTKRQSSAQNLRRSSRRRSQMPALFDSHQPSVENQMMSEGRKTFTSSTTL